MFIERLESRRLLSAGNPNAAGTNSFKLDHHEDQADNKAERKEDHQDPKDERKADHHEDQADNKAERKEDHADFKAGT